MVCQTEAVRHLTFFINFEICITLLHIAAVGEIVDEVWLVFGRPFVKQFAQCHQTVVCLSRLSVLSVTLVYCGQTVKRIKMKLGMQVGLGHCHTVLDGDPGPALLWPNGWMDEDATWYGSVDLRANHIVLDGFPALCERGTAPPPPPFRPMSVVATVAHLSYC